MVRSSEGTDKSGGETTRWEQEVERETQLVDRNEEAECFLEKKPKKVMLAGDSHMNCQNFLVTSNKVTLVTDSAPFRRGKASCLINCPMK